MHLERIAHKKLFLSGTDEAHIYNGRHFYVFPGGDISFIVQQLPSIEEATVSLPKGISEAILAQLPGAEKGLIHWRSAEGLKLHLLETPGHYIVIAAGEFQPGLHQIYIEAVFGK